MGVKFSNNAGSVLTAAITAGATSFDMDDVSELPTLGTNDYMYLTIVNTIDIEIIKVTGVSGNTLTVVRGQDGTTARAAALGDEIKLRFTTAMFKDALADNIAKINWKQRCTVGTTANITLSGEQTIDGVLTSASRVLVKDQTATAENGLYLSSSGAWSRVSDADVWDEYPSLIVAIEQGTVNEDTIYVCSADSGGTLETTSIVFVQFGSGGSSMSAATQAEQEAGTDVTVFTSPGRQQHHLSAARAWVKFNGTGTIAIDVSYNVSSVTDNGTGDYTINFTTVMPSIKYAAVGSSGNTSIPSLIMRSYTASSVRAVSMNSSGVLTDTIGVQCSMFVKPSSGGWSPFDIGAPIVVLDSSLGITLEDGDVSIWADQSGNGNDVLQTVATKQPIYIPSDSDFNNKPSIGFDKNSEYLQSAAFAVALAAPNTIFVVYRYNDIVGQQFVYDGRTSSFRNALFTDGSQSKMYAGFTQNIHTEDLNTHVFCGLYDAGSSDSWRDGIQNTPSGNTGAHNMDGLTLGSGVTAPVSLFGGDIAYVLIYNFLLSTADRNHVGNGLAAIFGTTWTD